MRDTKADAEYLMALDAVKNTVDRESEIRNILKNAARDHRLSTSEKDAILGVGRSKLRTLSLAARAAEHYGVDGLTVTGSNAGPLPAGLSVPAEVIAAPGGTLKIREGPIVEAELVESEPTPLNRASREVIGLGTKSAEEVEE